MVSPLIMSRSEVVSAMSGMSSMMLPMMILSGFWPRPKPTISMTASAASALASILCKIPLSRSRWQKRSAPNSSMPETAAVAASRNVPPKKTENAAEITAYMAHWAASG